MIGHKIMFTLQDLILITEKEVLQKLLIFSF